MTADRVTEARARLAEATTRADADLQATTLRRYRGRVHGQQVDARITSLATDVRAAFATVRSEARDNDRATFNRLATRVDELTFALVHRGVLPAYELHSTVFDHSDQWGGIPGCPCGRCPAEHVEDCRCLDCRNAAEDAAWRSPEAVEQRRLIREFCEQDEDE